MLKNAQIGQWCYMHGIPFAKDFLVIRKTALLVEFCVRWLRFLFALNASVFSRSGNFGQKCENSLKNSSGVQTFAS